MSNNDVISYIEGTRFADFKMALRYSNLLKLVGSSIKDLEVIKRDEKPIGFRYFDYRTGEMVEE